MSDPGSPSEAARYARAVGIGVAIAFVILVAAPRTPLPYVLAIGLYAAAVALVIGDR